MMAENTKYIGYPQMNGRKLFAPTIEKALMNKDKKWLTKLATMSKTSYSFMCYHIDMIRSFLKLPYEFWDEWVDEYNDLKKTSVKVL